MPFYTDAEVDNLHRDFNQLKATIDSLRAENEQLKTDLDIQLEKQTRLTPKADYDADINRLRAELATIKQGNAATYYREMWEKEREEAGGLVAEKLRLRTELERVQKENKELEQRCCFECDPDNYGWIFNRVEGKAVCGCISESEPFQIVETALAEILHAATGETQIADDDTEGMKWIADKALTALQTVLPLEYHPALAEKNYETN
jgi:hypothetical protein